MEVGQDGLPTSGSGSIVISDQWESLGENRRVFDYFDRYTPINQTVTVYRAIETIGDLDIPTAWTLIYTGKVESCSKDKESLTFSVTNTLVESKIATKLITEEMLTGYTVPESSLGKSLPLIFGSANVTVPAYPIATSDTDKSFAYYAYNSQLGTQFVEGSGSAPIYALNEEGKYIFVSGASSYTSADTTTNTASGYGYPTYHGKKPFLVPLRASLDGAIVTGLQWLCKGQNNGALVPQGTIILTLYKKSQTVRSFGETQYPQLWEAVASVEIEKSDYWTSLQGASDFMVYGVLEIPYVIEDDPTDYSGEIFFDTIPSTYAVGAALNDVSGYSPTSTTDFTSGSCNPATGDNFWLYADTTNQGWLMASGHYPLMGVDLADFGFSTSSIDSNGLSFKYFGVSQEARSDRKCDLQSLDLSISAPPIADDGSGTITGTINKFFYEPDEVCKLLGFTWNGSTWADGGIIDTATFSALTTVFTSGSYQRKVTGFTQGDTTSFDLISQVAREMCCFLVPLTSGKIALWPWGNTSTVTRVFTDADIIEVGSFEETDPSTVINNIKIEYGKNYLNINDQWEASGKAENLTGVIVINKGTSGYYNSILANSETLYGKRELEESGSQFIGDSTSATTRALYYALRHEHTHRTFTITVPYFDNTDLKLMDVIDICSVHGPSYFGSSSRARLPTYTGIEVDIYKNEYPRQATRRRCQIYGLNNDYDGDFPKLVITLREIKPRHKNDPTAANL